MTDEERAWLLDGDPRVRARNGTKTNGRGCAASSSGWRAAATRLTCESCWRKYRRFVTCPGCGGAKLKPDALNVRVDGRSIAGVGRLSMRDLAVWLDKIGSQPRSRHARGGGDARAAAIASATWTKSGLGYLTVERQARTLSGGEAQRIHLASALGSLLVGHAVRARRADRRTARGGRAAAARGAAQSARPRQHGGRRRARSRDDRGRRLRGRARSRRRQRGRQTDRTRVRRRRRTLTSIGVIAGTRAADARACASGASPGAIRRFESSARASTIWHGLDAAIPLGPDGLRHRSFRIGQIDAGRGRALQQLSAPLGRYRRWSAGDCDRIDGFELIGEMVHMGQELPARSMRSNPATYLKIYDDIRKLFAPVPKRAGSACSRAHFSFNVTGGTLREVQRHRHRHDRDAFHGGPRGEVRRVRRPPLPEPHPRDQATQSLNINQVLDLTVEDARAFFIHHPADRQAARRADRGRPRLHPARADHLDAVGRRGAAAQARALSAGRPRTRAGRPNTAGICRGCSCSTSRPPGSAPPTSQRLIKVLDRLVSRRQHAGRDRAQPRVHRARRLCHRSRTRWRRRGRAHRGGGLSARYRGGEKSETGRELRRLFGLPEHGRQARSALRAAAGA